jgi:hypothetical protein
MAITIYSIRVRTKLDRLIVRQRVRQIAGLLGYESSARFAIAAAVFEILCQHRAPCRVRIRQKGDTLRIIVGNRPAPARLSFALPEMPSAAAEDVAWIIREVESVTPINVFEETRLHNREYLRVLQKLHAETPTLVHIPNEAA